MGRRVAVGCWASLEVRRRGAGAFLRRLLTGTWPTYTSIFYGSMMLDVPDRCPDPQVYLATSIRGRPVVYCGADSATVIHREVKELPFQ